MRRLAGILAALLIISGTTAAQNFAKVIEIVGGMEETMKELISREEQTRKSEISALRTDLNSLRDVIARTGDGAAPVTVASTGGRPVLERLELLEARLPALESSKEMEVLAVQLDQLIDELKSVINDTKRPKEQTTAPAPVYTLTGQVRHRGELDGRSFAPEARTLGYNLLRTRLNLQIAPANDLKLFVQVQDSRLFGAGNPTLNRGVQDGMSKNIEFHQAYFDVRELYGLPLSVRVGRQEMAYGKQRLIASAGWNNVGNTFDAGTAQWKSGALTVDLFLAKLVGTQSSTNAENLAGGYAFYRFGVPLTADLFVIHDNNTTPLAKGPDKGSPRLGRYSMGTTVNGRPLPFDYEIEFILQRGSYAVTDSSAVSDIEAYLVGAGAGYLIDPASKFRVGAKFQLMSGDDDQKGGTYTTYNTLFSSAHSFFGYMDFFPKTLPEYGVQAVSLHASAEVAEGLTLNGDAYYYRFDAVPSVKTASGAVVKERSLGVETDLTVTHRYSANVTLNGGVSAFVPDDAMRAVKGPAVSYWTYLMTTVTF